MPTAGPVAIVRDLRLDLYRGLALWLIFLSHIPETPISWLTPRNYGFSDAAEMFFFVSGYANGYVYGPVMEQRGFLVSAAQLCKRAFQIYIAQMFLFMIFIGEVAYLSGGTDIFDDEMNVRIFHQHPDATILAVLQLRFMPVNMDVLPVYIVLLLAMVPMLFLLRRMPAVALATSAVVYLLANTIGLNLPAYPRGFWYFNPFAWQFVFVLGAWCGLGAADWLWSLVRSRVMLRLAAAYLVLALLVVVAWHVPQLAPYMPDWLQYPLGKTNLGILRLMHFLAGAMVVDRFIPRDWAPLRSRILLPVIHSGQHSLEIFCLGVALAFAGHVAIVDLSDSVAAQVLVSVLGIAAMVGVGSVIAWYNSVRVSYLVVEATEPPAMVRARPVDVAAPPGASGLVRSS